MADCNAVTIWDASRLVSGAAGGCVAKVTVAAGGEAEVLLQRADDWVSVPVDKTPASAGDGCLSSLDCG